MPPMLTTPVPSSVDTPGSFHVFTHVKAGGSLVPLALRVLLVGVKTSAGTAAALTPVQLLDVNDAITKCGQGSELALMAAKGIEQGLLNQSVGRGGIPEIWACPIAAPTGGAVAAVTTLTVTTTTAVAGTAILRIAGRYVYVGVSAGDGQNAIATAVDGEIDALAKELPITASVAANVVTCTHRTTGTNGNDVGYEVVSVPSGVSIAVLQTVAGTGTVDITAAVDASFDKSYDAVVISIHSAGAITDAIAHLTDAWTYSQKSWRWVVMGDKASLGTAQGYATSADTERIIVASCEGCPNLPSEIAVATAVAAWGVEAPNANYDDVELALYPPPTASAYTGAEVESAIDGGVTPLAPSFSGARLRIVRLVTTKITDGGAPYKLLADLAFIRTIAFRATQYDVIYRIQFRQENIDGPIDDPEATLLKRIRDMMVAVDRQMAKLGYLREVESFVPQFRVEEASAPQGRVLGQAPCKVAGPLHQVVFEHLNYL